MERVISGPVLCDTFWSIQEFYDRAVKDHDRKRTDINPRTAELVRDGWKDSVPQAMEIAEKAVASAVTLSEQRDFQTVWDVQGSDVDMGKYVTGEPECMLESPVTQTVKYGRTITIVSSTDANGSVGSGGFKARGICAVALALALSRLGYATEMWADNFGGDNPRCRKAYTRAEAYQRVLVKGTNDALDPAHLMFAYGHRAMLRELAFGTWDKWPGAWKETHSDGGQRGCAWDHRSAWVRDLYPAGTVIIIGAVDSDSPKAMAEYVMTEIRKLGLLPE